MYTLLCLRHFRLILFIMHSLSVFALHAKDFDQSKQDSFQQKIVNTLLKSPAAKWTIIAGVMYYSIMAERQFHEVAVFRHIELPESLKRLKHFEVIHLQSVIQDGPSCAWYSVLNAQALGDFLDSKKTNLYADGIAQDIEKDFLPTMKRKADEYARLMGTSKSFDGLYSDQKYKLAEEILKHSNFMTVDVWDNSSLSVKRAGEKELQGVSYADLKQSIVKPSLFKAYRHILLSIASDKDSRHAVLISLIYRENQKPLIVYMDSNNNTLELDQIGDSIYPGEVCRFLMNLDKT